MLFRSILAGTCSIVLVQILRKRTTVEEVVDVGQAEPQMQHQLAPVLVVLCANGGQIRLRHLPEVGREGEGFEAIGWGVA